LIDLIFRSHVGILTWLRGFGASSAVRRGDVILRYSPVLVVDFHLRFCLRE